LDTITHALSGALLARATAGNRPDALPLRARLLAGTAAAAFPDGDIVMRVFDAITYLDTHRGVTHSLVLLPLWSIALALLFATVSRGRFRWRQFAGVAALGLAIHIAGDVITSWGTMILAPLSGRRFEFATTFIIDPIFTAIIVAGLVAAWAMPKRAWIASGALLVLAGYVGAKAWLRSEAIGIGERYRAAEGLDAVSVEALPQPLSPLRWKILVETGDAYHETSVDLWRRAPAPAAPTGAGLIARLASVYQPRDRLEWRRRPKFGDGDTQRIALEAWNDPALAPYRRFARYAVLDHMDDSPAGRTCVFFQDLRFTLAGRVPVFRYGACRRGAGSAWRLAAGSL
jgi:inner membrane protein